MIWLNEAIASVALSHEDGCTCRVCRAAAGDTDAFTEIAIAMFAGEGL